MCGFNQITYPEEKIQGGEVIFYYKFPSASLKEAFKQHGFLFVAYPKSGDLRNPKGLGNIDVKFEPLRQQNHMMENPQELTDSIKYGLFSGFSKVGNFKTIKHFIYGFKEGKPVSNVADTFFSRRSENILYYLLPYGFNGCDESGIKIGLDELLRNTFIISEIEDEQ
jgi:hypothetical protein